MELGLSLSVVALFSVLAFWKEHFLFFLLTAGVAVVVGLGWYDAYRTSMGLSVSIMLYAYAIVCLAFTYRGIFKTGKRDE